MLFRLSKQTFLILLHMIEDEIKHQTCRNNAISPVNQLLVALRYYATGAFQVMLYKQLSNNIIITSI